VRLSNVRFGVESGLCYLALRLGPRHVLQMSAQKTRIMYIEDKSGGLNGPARIGRVTFSKSGKSLLYGERTFQSLSGSGFKANYFDVATGDHFWISGPRKDGRDRLYDGSTKSVEIDIDVSVEYWRDIRGGKPTTS
jgi:hypothetical protein